MLVAVVVIRCCGHKEVPHEFATVPSEEIYDIRAVGTCIFADELRSIIDNLTGEVGDPKSAARRTAECRVASTHGSDGFGDATAINYSTILKTAP
jgi:hypothetical protein